MKRRREVSAEERALFETTFADAKLSKTKPGAKKKPAAKTSTAKSVARPIPRAPRPTGLDGRTAERLSRGQLAPEAKLDLHGLTEDAAHRALVAFLRGAHARGVRLALVVTGKGGAAQRDDAPFDLGLDGRKRGVLRTMTPRWLKEPELARFVADTRAAHIRHGGAGALYVYLRKNG
ncbi:MAG TPA: Smr/MutS family protein [Rhizomicrobium sp.]|jgi:DNA-nicking Smr family endonuclease